LPKIKAGARAARFLLESRFMIQPAKSTAKLLQRCALAAAALVIAGCASAARLPVSAGTGPRPTLPPPAGR
jgi:hypothetical protein